MTKSGLRSVLVISFLLIASTSYAGSLSSAELINEAKRHDGKAVTYEGEVIGDIMKRGAYAWLNVSDGTNAIGVWIDYSLVEDITYTGAYKTKGDRLAVKGIFNRACLEHGGDLDIHAQAIQKISSGDQIPHSLDIAKIKVIGILLIIALFALCFDLFLNPS